MSVQRSSNTTTLSQGRSRRQRKRLTQEYQRQVMENFHVFLSQVRVLRDVANDADIESEPGELNPVMVLEMIGGPFGYQGVVRWCGEGEEDYGVPSSLTLQ
jgi:hypothetical protein